MGREKTGQVPSLQLDQRCESVMNPGNGGSIWDSPRLPRVLGSNILCEAYSWLGK